MFSYEDRLRAVQLYIKLDKRISLTIRQLGYRNVELDVIRIPAGAYPLLNVL